MVEQEKGDRGRWQRGREYSVCGEKDNSNCLSKKEKKKKTIATCLISPYQRGARNLGKDHESLATPTHTLPFPFTRTFHVIIYFYIRSI